MSGWGWGGNYLASSPTMGLGASEGITVMVKGSHRSNLVHK